MTDTTNTTADVAPASEVLTESPSEPLAPATDTTEDPETFPREYVEDLRKENGKYRTRAQQADDLAARLHTALVTATGRLQDPTDLVFDEDHLRDSPKMIEAIDALLTAKPHLANRKPTGDIGQGASGVTDTFSLSGLLRSGAK
ncbi:hypothetical protein [Cryobacterium sp. PH31-O1]|uniref:hypothetical protein n=1 Tax=Cryobacterium sp. PH31-O1 TaxID=3046306 RepID=UPI0024BBCAF4|nr:hypothetical protein [Cryobacterium sp. PH31-O1]MDJ0337630.1 hypothetical protein [Cryobacterium sp. PH31-O1]